MREIEASFSLGDHEKIRALIGKKLGTSEWFRIDQERINLFAKATDDPDPMHVDPEWAAKHTPFGGTIAFGFLTLSLLTKFSHEILEWTEDPAIGYALNYGLDRVRFVSPVPANARVRCHMTLLDAQERAPGQFLHKYGIEVEVENQERPALIAEWLGLRVMAQPQAASNPDKKRE